MWFPGGLENSPFNKKSCYDKIILAGMGVGLLTNQKFRIEPTCIIITLGQEG